MLIFKNWKNIPLSMSGKQELVGVDFSGDNLKLAHIRTISAKREIVNLMSRNIKGMSDPDISKVIGASFSDLKVKRPAIINTIPSQHVITKNIEIPSVDKKEIREIINLQAGRHTPYSREEIVVDYIDIDTYKQSYTKLLLVIVLRSVVKRQFDIINMAGLRVNKVFFAPEGLAWSASKIFGLQTTESPASIVHIDETFTDFSVIFKNKAVFIRSIPIGIQHLVGEKEKYDIRFVEELKNSLEAYRNENIEKSPNVLVLTGAAEEVRHLEPLLVNTLGLPIKMVPYFNNFPIAEEALKAASYAKHLSFLNIIAPLMVWEEMKVDLVPDEVRLKKSIEDRGKNLIKTGVLILTVFILIFFILIGKIYFKSAYLNKIDVKYKTLNEEAQNLERDFTATIMTRHYLTNRGYPLEVLNELYNVAPVDLEVSDIRFDEQGKFTVRGTAAAMSTVFAFVDGMEKSKYFKDVKTKYTSKRKDGLRDVADFELTCLLEKEP